LTERGGGQKTELVWSDWFVWQYVDEAQLKEMSSAPADYSYIYARDFSHLNLLVDQLLARLICSHPPPSQRTHRSQLSLASLRGRLIEYQLRLG